MFKKFFKYLSENTVTQNKTKKLSWFFQWFSSSFRVKIIVIMMTNKTSLGLCLSAHLSDSTSYYSKSLTLFNPYWCLIIFEQTLHLLCPLYRMCFLQIAAHLTPSNLTLHQIFLNYIKPHCSTPILSISPPPCSLLFPLRTYQHRNTIQFTYFIVCFFPLEHGLAYFPYSKYFRLCGPYVLCCNY